MSTPIGDDDALEVRDQPDDHRYEVWAAGDRAGFAAYRLHEDRIVFTHTEVEDRFEGQGVASVLVRGALDDVRRRGDLGVQAPCPYVSAWIERHPEYADLVVE